MSRVLIEILSRSLGDTVASIPYVERYREFSGDQIFLKINDSFSFLFRDSYPNINLISEGEEVAFDKRINLEYVHKYAVQEGYARQLGFIDYKYIRPVINFLPGERPIKNKYVAIGIHSTSQLKYWNHPSGIKSQINSPYWDELCGMIRKKGYTPVVVEHHELFGFPPHFNGMPSKSNKKFGQSLKESLNLIHHSEFYIGLSSGMTWVAHAMGKKVAMISNFTEDWNEFDLNSPDYKRITNKSSCHGCWNRINLDFKFDPNDWYWCPRHKGTGRQFECHTSITPETVFDEIKEWLFDTNK